MPRLGDTLDRGGLDALLTGDHHGELRIRQAMLAQHGLCLRGSVFDPIERLRGSGDQHPPSPGD